MSDLTDKKDVSENIDGAKVPAGDLKSVPEGSVPQGEPVPKAEPVNPVPQQQQIPPQPQPQFQQQTIPPDPETLIPQKHRVNKIVYFLLAFFFGAMGIHKFYAGHILTGIVFLALFFVGFLFTFVFGLGFLIITPLELIAVIQGIICLCKTTGPDGKVYI